MKIAFHVFCPKSSLEWEFVEEHSNVPRIDERISFNVVIGGQTIHVDAKVFDVTWELDRREDDSKYPTVHVWTTTTSESDTRTVPITNAHEKKAP